MYFQKQTGSRLVENGKVYLNCDEYFSFLNIIAALLSLGFQMNPQNALNPRKQTSHKKVVGAALILTSRPRFHVDDSEVIWTVA